MCLQYNMLTFKDAEKTWGKYTFQNPALWNKDCLSWPSEATASVNSKHSSCFPKTGH